MEGNTVANQSQQTITVNINQVLIAFVAAMGIACAFVAFVINTTIESKVSALTAQHAATSTAAPQTNNAPAPAIGCVDPAASASADVDVSGVVSKAAGTSTKSLGYVKYLPANVSYNQSNTQTTSSTSTNVNTDNRYSGNTLNSSHSFTNNQAWNNGNTTNSGNTTSTTTTTTTTTNNNITTVTDNSDNSVNTNIQDNGNTTNSGNTAVLTALGVVVLP